MEGGVSNVVERVVLDEGLFFLLGSSLSFQYPRDMERRRWGMVGGVSNEEERKGERRGCGGGATTNG